MQKFLSLTCLNAVDPLPALGRKVEPKKPAAVDTREQLIRDFETKVFYNPEAFAQRQQQKRDQFAHLYGAAGRYIEHPDRAIYQETARTMTGRTQSYKPSFQELPKTERSRVSPLPALAEKPLPTALAVVERVHQSCRPDSIQRGVMNSWVERTVHRTGKDLSDDQTRADFLSAFPQLGF